MSGYDRLRCILRDIPATNATLAVAVTSVSRYLFTGREAVRTGNRHPLSAPFGAFRARDGHFVLAILNNKLFSRFAAHIGAPELTRDERYLTDELRAANETELRRRIEAWSLALPVAQVCAELDAAGVPAAPIWNTRQAVESEQAADRGLFTPVEDDRLPGLRLPSQPIRFSAYAANQVASAPELGADTEQILVDVLGIAVPRLRELRELGVFG